LLCSDAWLWLWQEVQAPMAKQVPGTRGAGASVSVLADSTSMRMFELFRQNRADFERRYRAPAQELERRLTRRLRRARVAGEAASAALEEHLRAPAK
jgi:hypothetical protein